MTKSRPKIIDREYGGGVFFLWGEDEYSKGEAANELVELHLDESTRDFNLDVIHGSDINIEDLSRMVATPPMMAEWRVVMVKGSEALAGSSRARDLVLSIAESPPPGLALILTACIPSGSKAKFYSKLKKIAQSIEFPAITEDDVPGWLMDQAESCFAMELAPEAARAIASGVGADLGILSQELKKLTDFASEDDVITIEHVHEAGTIIPKADRWHWFDLVGGRKFNEASRELPILLSQGESGVGLTVGLATHFLRIGIVVEQGKKSLEEVLPPHQKWLSRHIERQADGWTSVAIREGILGLLRVDRLLKASSFSDQHHLEEWLLGLMVFKDIMDKSN